MTQTTTSMRQPPPKIVYNILNPVLKAIVRSPLHGLVSKRLFVLVFRGRKSGKQYAIPLGYVQTANMLLITSGSAWTKNFRDGAKVGMWLRGQKRTGTATVRYDEQGLCEGYRVVLAHAPQLTQITGVSLDANGEPRANELTRAKEHGFSIVRIELDPA